MFSTNKGKVIAPKSCGAKGRTISASIKLKKKTQNVVRFAPIFRTAITVNKSPVPKPKNEIKARKRAKCIDFYYTIVQRLQAWWYNHYMIWEAKPAPFRKFKKRVWEQCAVVSDFIYQIGEYPELRQKSKEVFLKKINEKVVQKKFVYLKKCLLNYRKLTGYGRGITAVQVGIPERYSVIFYNDELLLIVNPHITKISKKKYLYPEMCMSANPIIAPTVRPAWIEFTYYDEKGEKKFWNTKDDTEIGKMMNRVFQHEIDHMEGIINIDRVSSPKDLILQSDPTFYDSAKFEEI